MTPIHHRSTAARFALPLLLVSALVCWSPSVVIAEKTPASKRFRVVERPASEALVIQGQSTQADLAGALLVAFGQLLQRIDRDHLRAAGPLFFEVSTATEKTISFAAGIPVAAKATSEAKTGANGTPSAKNEITRVTLATGSFATVTYRGDYDGLSAEGGRLREWAKAKGYRPAKLYRFELIDTPMTEANPAKRRTLILVPLKR